MGVAKFSARFYQFREQLLNSSLQRHIYPHPKAIKIRYWLTYKTELWNKPTGYEIKTVWPFGLHYLPTTIWIQPTGKSTIIWSVFKQVLPDTLNAKGYWAEYLGFVFIKAREQYTKRGKSLNTVRYWSKWKKRIFWSCKRLIGFTDNVSSYSLQSLTNDKVIFRAKLANKLVNYASEINGKLETSILNKWFQANPLKPVYLMGNHSFWSSMQKCFNVMNYPKTLNIQTPISDGF